MAAPLRRWSRPLGVPLRRPEHPGRFLHRQCLAPLALTQTEAARRLGVSRRRLHELVQGQRAMSADTAVRCALLFGLPAELLLAMQARVDSFQAWKRLQRSAAAHATTHAH